MGTEDELEEAISFLKEELKHDPVRGTEILKSARSYGISRRALNLAATKLRIVRVKGGIGGHDWYWSLPDPAVLEFEELLKSQEFFDPGNADDRVDIDTVAQLLNLSGTEFEKCVAGLLQSMGFHVQVTAPTNDGEVDVLADSTHPITGGRYVIQCKRFMPDNLVGSPAVRDFYGALCADQKAIKGILITTSGFTAEAKQFAANLRMELIDGRRLEQLLSEFKKGSAKMS